MVKEKGHSQQFYVTAIMEPQPVITTYGTKLTSFGIHLSSLRWHGVSHMQMLSDVRTKKISDRQRILAKHLGHDNYRLPASKLEMCQAVVKSLSHNISTQK